ALAYPSLNIPRSHHPFDAGPRRKQQTFDLEGLSKAGLGVRVVVVLSSFPIAGAVYSMAWLFDRTAQTRDAARFRQVVDSAPNGVLLVDLDGTITFCNSAACEMFGYPSAELTGESVDLLVPVRPGVLHAA